MNDKFFKLPSVPGVMFLKGTSFKDCVVINSNLSIEEYNLANGIKVKKEKVKLSDKKEKFKPENKKEKFKLSDKKG